MKILFYEVRFNRSPISDFIDSLSKKDQAFILLVLKNITLHGFKAKGASFRQIDRKLWEIKIRTSVGSYRFFYSIVQTNVMLVLHAIKKKSRKAPKKDILLALKRLKEAMNEEN